MQLTLFALCTILLIVTVGIDYYRKHQLGHILELLEESEAIRKKQAELLERQEKLIDEMSNHVAELTDWIDNDEGEGSVDPKDFERIMKLLRESTKEGK